MSPSPSPFPCFPDVTIPLFHWCYFLLYHSSVPQMSLFPSPFPCFPGVTFSFTIPLSLMSPFRSPFISLSPSYHFLLDHSPFSLVSPSPSWFPFLLSITFYFIIPLSLHCCIFLHYYILQFSKVSLFHLSNLPSLVSQWPFQIFKVADLIEVHERKLQVWSMCTTKCTTCVLHVWHVWCFRCITHVIHIPVIHDIV